MSPTSSTKALYNIGILDIRQGLDIKYYNMYHGFMDKRRNKYELTLQQIGDYLGLTRERIRQLEQQGHPRYIDACESLKDLNKDKIAARQYRAWKKVNPDQDYKQRFYQRFYDRTVRNLHREDLGYCWEWSGYKHKNGYGRVSFKGNSHWAHQVSYIISYGPILPSLCVLHHCDIPACVNPEHLYMGTYQDNARNRSIKRSNRSQGTRSDTAHEIRIARLDHGLTQTKLADLAGISIASVVNIELDHTSGSRVLNKIRKVLQ